MDNAELAYLLGMIAGKGEFIRDNSQTKIIITIPHKALVCEGMPTQLSVKASLDDIRNSIEPLIGTRLQSNQDGNKTTLAFTKDNGDLLIREINRYFGRLRSFKDFRIPQDIFRASVDIKRIFIIGLADVTAYIRRSNAAFGQSYHHRTYIEMPANWYLVIDIANLLHDLDVPIHTIDWAHPNMRDPNLKDYNSGKHNAWAREHQIKVFADEYEKVGFRIVHKKNALEELSRNNRSAWDNNLYQKIQHTLSEATKQKYQRQIGHIEINHHRYYWETKSRDIAKPSHPMENSPRIPEKIRGRHFDSWKDICRALGYPRSNNE